MDKYENITIYADPSPNGMVNVSALAYESNDSEDSDDSFDFQSQEFDDRTSALSFAGDEARSLVDSGIARSATVLYDGSETFYYDGKKTKGKRAKRNPARFREGTRVRYKRTIAEAAYASTGAQLPEPGELGTVTSLPVGRGRSTTMGFLTYVKWDSGLVVGVSTGSLERVGKTAKNPRYTEDELREKASNQRLFVGMGATGITFADRNTQEHGDYKRCAHLPYDTLELDLRSDCPKALVDEIIAQAAIYHSMAGQQIEVSSSGQKVTLGRKRGRRA